MMEVSAFLGLMLLCDPNEPTQCGPIRGAFFETYDECIVDLATNGLGYVTAELGTEVHIAFFDCLEVNLEGEPA